MKQSDLAIIQSDMLSFIATAVNNAHDSLTASFAMNHKSNEVVERYAKCNRTLAKLVLAQALHPVSKMWLDEAKANVDKEIGTDDDDELVPGCEVLLYEDNVFWFTKRMTKNTSTCSTRDLCIELARGGVVMSLVATAFASSERVRQGNADPDVR